uniref:Uncharacterized protein n=1 Tax=viral metagenome TaxID=1070528 RepID=A0A6C0J3X4_9ZZZZ
MLNLKLYVELDTEKEERRKKQEQWRQKQLNIFYRTGKPIYRITLDTQFLRTNNTPHSFIEKKKWEN